MKKILLKTNFLVLMLLLITACGGGGSNSSNSNTSTVIEGESTEKTIVGYLVDAPIANMSYKCGDKIDKTTNEGKFECSTLPVTFKISSFVIAKVDALPADGIVYPQDLVGAKREDISNPEVLKIASFLQSLDSDGDLSIINIPDNLNIENNKTLTDMNQEEINQLLESQNIKPIGLNEAEQHLRESIGITSTREEEENNSSSEESNLSSNLNSNADRENSEPNTNDMGTSTNNNQYQGASGNGGANNQNHNSGQSNVGNNDSNITNGDNNQTENNESTITNGDNNQTDNNDSNITNEDNNQTNINKYPYIPKDKNLTYDTTFRFLQKTTFGPTQELIDEVEKKGIVPWLEEQLNQTYELNDSLTYQTLKMGQTINPFAYNHDISEYMAEDTTLHLPPWGSDHIKVRDYFISSWAKDVFFGKKQVQMRVAYALSQIIVASNSAGVFHGKYQGLAAYYDLMKKHALGNYGELLKEVSTNPAMGYYLTFYGNQKKHLNSRGEWVYPDENYAREVMQLFSISPFLLNMDGTKVLDNNGEPVPSYTQDDVNELARVFTGLDFRLAKNFGNTGTRGGDLIHKMECHDNYHDTDEKTLLGKTIPEGGDCYNDVDKAIDILMSHQNTAPFIAKKLIMRLAKSNPSPEYVQRVAQVFENNGKGEKGDIKATVRAVYFDKEFWDDIVNKRSMKYKEPLIAFTQMARTFHVKPYPKWHLKISSSDTKEIRDKKVVLEDTGLIWIDSLLGDIFGEGPTQSKTVFNFYSDDYVPSDDYFLKNNYVAPEIQIQTDGAFVAYHNYIYDVTLNEKNYALNKHGVNLYNPYKFKVYTDMKEFGNDLDMVFHKDKFYFDLTPYYKLVEDTLREEVDGKDLEEILDKAHEEQYLFSLELRKKAISKVVDLLDKELTGNSLNDEFKRILVDKYAIKLRYWDSRDQRLFYMLVLKMLVQMVVIYDDYKVE